MFAPGVSSGMSEEGGFSDLPVTGRVLEGEIPFFGEARANEQITGRKLFSRSKRYSLEIMGTHARLGFSLF